MNFKADQFHFDAGEVLVGFTDGVTDARNAANKPFSEARLMQVVCHPWSSIFSMLFELNVELHQYIGEQKQFDDITLISFKRNLALQSNPDAICRTALMSNLEDLRRFTESAVTHAGLHQDLVFAFKLAVDEICANIIQYGYEGREPGLISLTFQTTSDLARLMIRDDGKYFPPNQAQSPDVEADWSQRPVGGLGLFFVQELMDQVAYERTDQNFNQYVLEKKLKVKE
jgi:anti-sigma regulatory factor (Ser/Thr protein kinase)